MTTEAQKMTQRDTGIRRITVTENGPYQVEGSIPLAKQTIIADAEGSSRDWLRGEPIEATASYRLCRCGHSASKPFCDDTHLKIRFDGTEVASREPYLDQVEVFEGAAMDLTDAQSLCASGRFCDPDGSIRAPVERTDNPKVQEMVERMAGNCPSGRLVVWDKSTGQPREPDLEASIGLIEDPVARVSGPLWVRGGIAIESADGQTYEVRNRVTLCRCGASSNKPFCDGSHVSIGFQDGL
jgi:CDGSH-type Zn-finger protein